MSAPISNDDLARVRAAAAAGNTIEAIKLYRAATGTGLAEAKKCVESLMAGRAINVASPVDAVSTDDIDAIEAAVFAGQKIPAIRLYREATGQGLKESKDFVDALEAELRRTDPTKFTAPEGKGCGVTVGTILILCALLVGLAWAS